MNYTYSNDINNYYLHITEPSSDTEINDFRVKMLLHNRLEGFIPLNITYTNNLPEYTYNITGLTSLENVCHKEKITFNHFLSMIGSLNALLCLSDKYLLNTDNFIFTSEFIYVNPESFQIFVCYCPFYSVSFKESFYDFVCFLLNHIDYEDNNLVEKVYDLQKDCIKSQLPIKVILDKILEENVQNMELPISDYSPESEKADPLTESHSGRPLKPCKINKHLMSDVEKKKLGLRHLLPYIKLTVGSILIYILLIFLQIKFHLLSTSMLLLLIPVLLGIIGYSIYKVIKLREKYYDAPLITSLLTKNISNTTITTISTSENSNDILTSAPESAPESEATNPSKLIPEDKVHYDVIKLTSYPFTIGKISGNTDGYIFSPLVSRVHARITYDDEKFFIQDLNSANGTLLNGENMQPETLYPLNSGDIISFSTINYTFLCN